MTGGEGEMLRCFGLGLAVAGKAYQSGSSSISLGPQSSEC